MRRPRICLRSSSLRASSRSSSAFTSFRQAKKLLAPRTSLESAWAGPVLLVTDCFFFRTEFRTSSWESTGERDLVLLTVMDGTIWKQSVISTNTLTRWFCLPEHWDNTRVVVAAVREGLEGRRVIRGSDTRLLMKTLVRLDFTQTCVYACVDMRYHKGLVFCRRSRWFLRTEGGVFALVHENRKPGSRTRKRNTRKRDREK